MLIVFTGNGKGKTTSALGQAVRTVGRGKSVLMIQFIKGPWKSGEDFINVVGKEAEAKVGKFKLVKMGMGFVGILGDKLPKEEHAKAAKKALEYFKSEMSAKGGSASGGENGPPTGGWDLIILDEINVAVSLGLLTPQEVLDSVKDLPPEKFVIFTGRGAPKEFIDRADLVTEMKEIKHPFNDGRLAKIAVEF